MSAAYARVRLPLLAVLALCLLPASPAGAERYPPSPQPDDLAFVQLGAVGELVAVELYRSGADSGALAAPQRAVFRRLAEAGAKDRAGLNRLLGEEPITGEEFAVRIPGPVLRSRGRTLALAARFERLLAGLYLSGVQSTLDPPTRLIIGRHLAAATRNLALVRGLRGTRLDLRPPRPLSVEYVGIQFDRYLAIPGV